MTGQCGRYRAHAVCQKTSRYRCFVGYYALGCRPAAGYILSLMDCKYNNKVMVVVMEVGVSGIRTWLPECAGDVFTARG